MVKRRSTVKALVLDIDGVITDGAVLCSADGPEHKRYAFRDVDAVFEARRRGFELALVTGESSAWVDTIAARLEIEHVVSGAKDKLEAMTQLAGRLGLPLESLCYVGDSDRDAPALEAVGLGLAPMDATQRARNAADKVLSLPGGAGAVDEAVRLILDLSIESQKTVPGSPEPEFPDDGETIQVITRESLQLQQRTIDSLAGTISTAADAICATLGRGGTIYAFGNGGSASDAEHLVAELIGRFEIERPGLAAVALTSNSSATTAIANDYGYDAVFQRQIAALSRPGDVAVAVTTSGNSRSIIAAVQTTRDRGVTTIAMTGRDGGRCAPLVDIELRVPSDSTARIQEGHRLIIHILCALVERRLHTPGSRRDA